MGKFTIKGIYGEGIGTEISEDAIYNWLHQFNSTNYYLLTFR